jgi:hypothetical protein
MYANLRVTYRNSKGTEREVYAWGIEREASVLVIKLDANDGESNYAVEAGERRISPANLVSVRADF